MVKKNKCRAGKIDVGFFAIAGLVILVSGWLLSMPVCRFIQRATLNRFHFQTRSFAVWAIQQPIPAMYNFYNRFEISPSRVATKSTEPKSTDLWDSGAVNHFPLRLFTFGDNRAVFLPTGEPRQIEVWSSYRGEELHTRWMATPHESGGFDFAGEIVK
jgi:hypothetical protein